MDKKYNHFQKGRKVCPICDGLGIFTDEYLTSEKVVCSHCKGRKYVEKSSEEDKEK